MSNYVEMIVIILFLLVCSYYDIKEKIIYTNICVLFFLASIIVELVILNKGLTVLMCGIIPAVFVFVISIISNESIGKGDAFIFLVIGIILGVIETFVVFIMALVITVIYSIPLIVFKQKNLKISLPFSPFILTSFIIVLCFNGGKV